MYIYIYTLRLQQYTHRLLRPAFLSPEDEMNRLTLEEIIEMRMQDCVGVYGTSRPRGINCSSCNYSTPVNISTKWGRCFKVNLWWKIVEGILLTQFHHLPSLARPAATAGFAQRILGNRLKPSNPLFLLVAMLEGKIHRWLTGTVLQFGRLFVFAKMPRYAEHVGFLFADADISEALTPRAHRAFARLGAISHAGTLFMRLASVTCQRCTS